MGEYSQNSFVFFQIQYQTANQLWNKQKKNQHVFVWKSKLQTHFLCSGDKHKEEEEEEVQSPPTWILCFTSFNHLALVFNASVNFLIYFSCGNAFKRALLNALPLLRLFPR